MKKTLIFLITVLLLCPTAQAGDEWGPDDFWGDANYVYGKIKELSGNNEAAKKWSEVTRKMAKDYQGAVSSIIREVIEVPKHIEKAVKNIKTPRQRKQNKAKIVGKPSDVRVRFVPKKQISRLPRVSEKRLSTRSKGSDKLGGFRSLHFKLDR